MHDSVAWGVTSRAERPVPPVVNTRSSRRSSAICWMAAAIWSASSGTMMAAPTAAPAASIISRMAGPPRSSRSPLNEESLTVMIPTAMSGSCSAMLRLPAGSGGLAGAGSGGLVSSNVLAALAADLMHESDLVDHHLFVHSLAHVVDGQCGGGDGGQR